MINPAPRNANSLQKPETQDKLAIQIINQKRGKYLKKRDQIYLQKQK